MKSGEMSPTVVRSIALQLLAARLAFQRPPLSARTLGGSIPGGGSEMLKVVKLRCVRRDAPAPLRVAFPRGRYGDSNATNIAGDAPRPALDAMAWERRYSIQLKNPTTEIALHATTSTRGDRAFPKDAPHPISGRIHTRRHSTINQGDPCLDPRRC